MIQRTAFWVVVLLLVCGLRTFGQSSNPVQYFYDDLGRLVKVVDGSGNAATYSYDAVGNILQITRSTVPANNGLAILSFGPQSGFVGQTVTIQGQGFSTTPGSNVVRFNGIAAVVSAATTSSLTVTVPTGATTGLVSVTVGGTTVNSDRNFTIVPASLVSISVTPLSDSVLSVVQQFTATGAFNDGSTRDVTQAVTWTSSNPSVATISNAPGSQGLARGVTSGVTTIIATSGPVIGTSRVSVVVLASLHIFPDARSIAIGATQQFTAFGDLTDGSGRSFTNLATWSSSNPAVATIGTPVGDRVFATGVGNGVTSITATFGSISATTTLTVGTTTASVFPRFALVAGTDGSVSFSSVNPNTGQLRANGYVFDGAGGFFSSIVIDPSGKFAYVANGNGGNTVSAFAVTPNGTLNPVPGSPFAAGTLPVAVAVDPLGRFLYTANRDSDSISAYTINAATGALTPTPLSPFVGATGGGPQPENPDAITVDPAGKFVFVAEGGVGKVAVYAINQLTGDLVEITASPFNTGNGPAALAVDPLGKILYVESSSLLAFSINQTTGSLAEITGSPFNSTLFPTSLALDPAGKFAYELNGNSIFGFTIDQTTGGLTAVAGSPFAVGPLSRTVTVDPSSNYVYVVNAGNNTVSIFGVDPNSGSLTNLGSFPQRAPSSIAISKGTAAVTYTPQFAYVANAGPPSGSNNVSGYSINSSTGALTALSGSPFAEGFSPTGLTADFLAPFLYATNKCSDLSCVAAAGSVGGYSVDPSAGLLTALPGSPYVAGNNPLSVAVDPSGRFAYAVNNADNTLSAYAINPSNGVLTAITGSPFAAGPGPESLAIDSTGLFLYVVNSCPGSPCTAGSVSAYTISSVTGVLTSIGSFAVGRTPQWLTIDPTGRFVYVANTGDATLSAFTIDRTSGALNSVAGSPFATGLNPSSVAVDPTGKFAYAANSGANSVSAYAIDSSSGALAAISSSPFVVGTNPASVTVDISGSFLYVVNKNNNSVSAFSIDPTTGALTQVSGSPFGTGTNPISVTTTGKIQ